MSEAATVTIRLQQHKARRVGHARYVTVARLQRAARAGRGTIAFSGRVPRMALSPGHYRAVLQAADAAGNRGRSRTIAFTVLGR